VTGTGRAATSSCSPSRPRCSACSSSSRIRAERARLQPLEAGFAFLPVSAVIVVTAQIASSRLPRGRDPSRSCSPARSSRPQVCCGSRDRRREHLRRRDPRPRWSSSRRHGVPLRAR
jgi:hypothetical protein